MNAKIMPQVDKNWTLFLDRDGVINVEKENDYIHNWSEFKFYDGVQDALQIFADRFGPIIVVTNQRGIARGLTKTEDLEQIHTNMIAEIQLHGGRIDQVYYCGDMEGANRKPNPGMGLQALKENAAIDLNKSIMIGNNLSDMRFGRNLGVALNIFLPTTRRDIKYESELIDLVFPDLHAVALAL